MYKKKVTVLMPVFNAEEYLYKAVESVLNQTYKDFDLLVIDDGSTDRSKSIIEDFNDKRIKMESNKHNMGIVKTLNKGLSLIEGEYIIRMDSDDICHPTRFEKQVKFMDEHPHLAVSGTSIEIFNQNGQKKKVNVPTEPKKIRTQLLFDSALKHPSVIIRNSIIKENNYTYNEDHKATEDLGLWQKISFKYDLSNMDKVLLDYRDNEFGITRTAEKDSRARDESHMRVYKQFFDYLTISYTEEQVFLFRQLIALRYNFSKESNKKLNLLLTNLRKAMADPRFDKNHFDQKVGTYFRNNALLRELQYKQMMEIYKEDFISGFNFQPIEKTKFLIKSLIK